MIYFDNAATSFPKPDKVYDKIMKVMKEYGANPGRSGHSLSLKVSREIFQTRDLIAELFNVDNPMNIVFTFNCTESLNLGIKGILKPGDHVITTSMEHNSVLRPIRHLRENKVESTIVDANKEGIVDPIDIKKAIRPNTRLIVVTHISNLTGTIQPIKEIGRIAKENNIYYLVDAAQSAGVYDIDVEKMNIDILAFPGHKELLGPQGTGGLYIRDGIDIEEIFQGGTGSTSDSLDQPEIKPDKYESGTSNAPGIIGLGEGVRYVLNRGIDNIRQYKKDLTMYFIENLKEIEGVNIYGPLDINKQAAVVSLNVRDISSSEIAYILDDQYNIAVRSGMHCAPLAHKTIGSFQQGTVRFSFGIFNTYDEIDYAIKSIKEIVKSI